MLSVAPFLEFERKSKGERDPTICPQVRIPMHWGGFPPNSRVLVLSEQLGFYDALCYFATASGSDFGKPPDDVQQLYRDKLRHIQSLRCSVETPSSS